MFVQFTFIFLLIVLYKLFSSFIWAIIWGRLHSKDNKHMMPMLLSIVPIKLISWLSNRHSCTHWLTTIIWQTHKLKRPTKEIERKCWCYIVDDHVNKRRLSIDLVSSTWGKSKIQFTQWIINKRDREIVERKCK